MPRVADYLSIILYNILVHYYSNFNAYHFVVIYANMDFVTKHQIPFVPEVLALASSVLREENEPVTDHFSWPPKQQHSWLVKSNENNDLIDQKL